jgi:hypothetical protein
MTDDLSAAGDEQLADGAGDHPPRDLISRILEWLRAGYPDGVPQHDYVALLGILQRNLTSSELDQVVEQLSPDAGSGEAIITAAEVREGIEEVVKGPATDADIARVSARLAAAGWPLWCGRSAMADEHATVDEPVRPGLVSQIIRWLRRGYPTEVPAQDFSPLVALLRRRLTDAEVAQVSLGLVETGALPPDRVDVGTAIAMVTSELPSEQDIARVRRHLTDHGWPVDFTL